MISSKSLLSLNRKTSSIIMIFCLVLSLVPAHAVFAEANQLIVKPVNAQMNLNTTFTVNIRSYADTDESYGTAVGSLTFPTDKLQVVGSPSAAGSDYTFSSAPAVGGGAISFNGSRSPAAAGFSQLFSVTFKTIGAGTAVVSFSGGSTVNNETTSYSSGAYTIINPNPPKTIPKTTTTPKPSTAPAVTTPTPTPTPASTEGPVVTPDSTGLIDTVNITSLYSSATVVWTLNTDKPSTPSFVYGSTAAALDKSSTVTRKSDGSYQALISGLSPGTRYIFSIAATGDNGKPTSYTGSIFTRGYPVTITVTQNNVPVQSGQIQIGSVNTNINSNGKATIGLASGSYTGTITTDSSSLSINLTVQAKPVSSDGSAPGTQTFSYDLPSSPLQGDNSGTSVITFIIVLIIGTLIIGVGFASFIAYRRKRFDVDSDAISYSSGSGTSVVIDDGYTWREQNSAKPQSQPSQPQQQQPVHHNSVYLSEEEPLDMFDKANGKLPPDSKL